MSAKTIYRPQMRKSIWCEGCGLGNLQQIFTKILVKHVAEKLGVKASSADGLEKIKNNIAMVSGIGCTSRMPGHFDVNTLHTTHGRSLGFATGLKMARPDLTVALVAGDGDIFSIGGNHFIHAARRNPDLTLIVYDNQSYGMTGSQHSPTSPTGEISSSAPYGVFEPTFNVIDLAVGAGASFVAQGTITTSHEHQEQLEELIEKALKYKGFSFVNVRGTCHTGWGSRNKRGDAYRYRQYLESVAVPLEKWSKLSAVEKAKTFPTGIIHCKDRPDLANSSSYLSVVDKCRKAKGDEEVAEAVSATRVDPIAAFERTAIRFAGSGGQGVISAGEIALKAALQSGQYGVFMKNYGPEARGGEAYSDLILSKGEIYFPQASELDVLLALNQETFDKFRGNVKPDGKIIANSTSVTETYGDPRVTLSPIGELHSREVRPAKRELGINVTALAVVLDYLGLVPQADLEAAIMKSVGKKDPAMNKRALAVGFKEAARLKR